MRGMVLIAAGSLFAAGCGSSKTTQTMRITTTAAAAAPAAFLPGDCLHEVERPSTFIIACADAGSGVEQLVWHSWGAPVAQGRGFAFANDCVPSCVAGGVHHSAAEMYVSRLRHCGSKLQYTYAVIIAAKTSIAYRTTGAYNIACGGPTSAGVSRTEPEQEAAEAAEATRLRREAPTDREVRQQLHQLEKREAERKK